MIEDTLQGNDIIKSLEPDVSSNHNDVEDSGDDGLINYEEKYRTLKRKLKCLLQEQECFHEELRKVQRKCLRVNRDKSFLLDRLLQYEDPELSSSDDEMTASSSDEEKPPVKKQNLKKSRPNKSLPKTSTLLSSSKSPTASPTKPTVGEKVRCRRVEKGKQCCKLVSMKIKSGICYAHRQQINADRQGQTSKSGTNSPSLKSPTNKVSSSPSKPSGGKDIGQIREAMEASSHTLTDGMYGEDEDELVIDLPR